MRTMMCPCCATIAGDGAERCSRCNGLLARPDQPDTPIPVLRAPTRRGEAIQRAAGVVTTVLAGASRATATSQAPAPALATTPMATGPASPMSQGLVSAVPGTAASVGTATSAGTVAASPALSVPTPASRAPASTGPASAGGLFSVPPPPPALPSAGADPTLAIEHPGSADVTTVIHGRRPEDATEETRVSPRPGAEAWPPPPGTWSGRRAPGSRPSES